MREFREMMWGGAVLDTHMLPEEDPEIKHNEGAE